MGTATALVAGSESKAPCSARVSSFISPVYLERLNGVVWWALPMARTLEKFTRDSWLRALSKTQSIGEDGLTLPLLMDRLAGQHGGAPALSGPDGAFSFD